ncbi:hypothetical protein INT44_004240 [Umbelopsis vinacea]|uniref:Cyclin-domain-containing protein n=1 Tax=Umbelopsis vinacea TaxID=44442 RepID=A0A8H7UR85_9FUNG|nr:hypothetical protein INT44_004240 [Umbelopsis vinacea]
MSFIKGIPSFPETQRLPVMPTLNSNNPDQLADFCAFVVPCIWGDGWAKLGTSTVDSKRYSMFRSFCKDVISATQISSSCILVSLRYIRVLRSCYPSIKGSVGSEFRLFTTSLILANKFLDDNTYTNKTWSEVSNIPVNELNIMEIEFLSALDYNVYVSEEQYLSWISECDRLIAMDSRRKYRPIKTPTALIGKSPSKSSVRSTTGAVLGKGALPPLVHSMSQPILPTSLKRSSAGVVQATPTKRICLPNTPPPDDAFHHYNNNILPPIVRSSRPSSTCQFYDGRPHTPVYTPTISDCYDPFVTIPVTYGRYPQQQQHQQQQRESFLPSEKLLPSWSSMPSIAAPVQPTPIYFRPQTALSYRQQQGLLSLAL